MTVDQFIAQYVPAVSDLDCFRNFDLDMTQSMVIREVDGRLAMVPAMDRVSGQKESERKLYSIVSRPPMAPVDLRAENLAEHTAQYAANPAYEVEVDYFAFAIGLANACREYGFEPTFLLDENGDF